MIKYKKTLMILGGSVYALPLIKEAHKYNVKVITVDYLPGNIAHKYSDAYLNISVVDKESVLKAAMQYKIDGISSFGCDAGVVTAAYIAEKLNLPSQGPVKSISLLQNKNKFREFLKSHNFNVPFFASFKTKEEALKNKYSFELPIIIKPTDSCGSKGVSKVINFDDFDVAVDDAFQKSLSKEIIIEEYIEKKGCSSDADCFSINGKLDFFVVSDQWFDINAANKFVPSCISFPSNMEIRYQIILKNELQRLIKLLGLTTSLYNVEARVNPKNDKVYLMEVSPRGGGNRICETIFYAYGRNLIEEHVCYVCNLQKKIIPVKSVASKPNEITAYFAIHSNKKGKFKGVKFDNNFEKTIIDKQIWISQGQEINFFRGANDTIGTLICKFEDRLFFEKVAMNPNEYIEIELIN